MRSAWWHSAQYSAPTASSPTSKRRTERGSASGRERERERRRAYHLRPEVKERSRALKLAREYGLTPEEHEAIIVAQGHRCALCGRQLTAGSGIHTDHCHETGVVRGILCRACNSGLGFFEDDPGRLAKDIRYLTSSGSRQGKSERRPSGPP